MSRTSGAGAGNRKALPRELAIRVLTRVLSDRQPLDEALAAVSGEVPPEHRAWLQDVCSGTLRWKGRIDHVIDSVALRKKPSGWLRKALSVGAYQLLAQERVQPALIVSETVESIKRKEGDAPARFGNAVLRKIADHAPQWRQWKVDERTPAKEAASWASLPEWLWKKLVAQRGFDWACRYAEASLERPFLWLRARDPSWSPDWAEPGPVPGSLRVKVSGEAGAEPGGAIHQRPEFQAGGIFVQDISSQLLVAEATRAVRERLREGQERARALDLCAAPGGKAVGMGWSGLQVAASDRDGVRLQLLKETVARIAPREVTVEPQEAVERLEPMDLVWVDAPCTGTGILRRHPDVRWLKRESDLESLGRVQLELLRSGYGKVRPGGLLMYSVCSVLKEEGEELVSRAELPGAKSLRQWLLLPQEEPGGDGFWATLIERG